MDRIGHAAGPNAERRIKPPAEMARLFARFPEAVANTILVPDACSVFPFDQLRYQYPEVALEPGEEAPDFPGPLGLSNETVTAAVQYERAGDEGPASDQLWVVLEVH
ncbi:MAG: Error-prone repair homolog of DNA polymerase III alpha subunit [uncultured Friedmanniella sp.]|uniref:Error-prone repair homolog of DNA polymerase III alpha subunit n=1 Tax=uncultured Friedmanniella sp. TaxID=335381 RepID=A0A6J4KN52_9ACTN|nr:MAG: Error-prone repair homolog of DNA polymerase III alpha subunit [uncultured Friedmanniella sp.]